VGTLQLSNHSPILPLQIAILAKALLQLQTIIIAPTITVHALVQLLHQSNSAAFFRPLPRGEEREVGMGDWVRREREEKEVAVLLLVVMLAHTLVPGGLSLFVAVATALTMEVL
jgi:hypothetical protein